MEIKRGPLASWIRHRHVLITGVPNFVAVQIAWKIVETEPETQITMLVRRDLVERAERVLQTRVGVRARVSILVGDIVAPDLGLRLIDTEILQKKITDIYHLASIYHLGIDKAHAYEVNVLGTRHVLAFAKKCNALVRLNHFSTSFVSGDREGVILERELDRGQHFRNTFERTKFAAEIEIRRAQRELPISIFRPSLVVGDSKSGVIDRMDGPYFFIQMIVLNPTRLPIPLPSTSRYPLNVVPIDFVAEAAHALSLNPETVGKTFHLVDPNPLTAPDVFKLVAEHAKRISPRGKLPQWLTNRLLRLPIVERYTRNSRAFLHEMDTLTIFNSMNTLMELAKTQITCPPFPTYVGNLVSYLQQRDQRWLSNS